MPSLTFTCDDSGPLLRLFDAFRAVHKRDVKINVSIARPQWVMCQTCKGASLADGAPSCDECQSNGAIYKPAEPVWDSCNVYAFSRIRPDLDTGDFHLWAWETHAPNYKPVGRCIDLGPVDDLVIKIW
jgi:hypothetical protein